MNTIKDVHDFLAKCNHLSLEYVPIEKTFVSIDNYLDAMDIDFDESDIRSITYVIDYEALFRTIDLDSYHETLMSKHNTIRHIKNIASMKNVNIIFVKKKYFDKKPNKITPCDTEYDTTMNVIRYSDPEMFGESSDKIIIVPVKKSGSADKLKYPITSIQTESTNNDTIGNLLFGLMSMHIGNVYSNYTGIDVIKVISDGMYNINRQLFATICDSIEFNRAKERLNNSNK